MPKQSSAMKKCAVRGSKSGRPIMALLDLLGPRWTLRILWELREQPLTSRGLRRSLAHGASGAIVGAAGSGPRRTQPASGYGLTAIGRELLENFLPLHRFAERWSKRGSG
jgi:DNA-binding HxlR family transcriptional regulator